MVWKLINVTIPGIQSRPKPPDYDEAWYEDPSDGQWYNQYDWYEDECGEWAYDYRMDEYGYTQNEMGEWVPMPGVETSAPPGSVPSQKQTSSGPGDKGLSGDQKPQPDDKSSLLAKAESKDGFSLFNDSKPAGAPASAVPVLPPRPPDFDDYWYQAEDGNWYNEYEDMGLVFADPEASSKSSSLTNNKVVPNKIDSNGSQKQSQKPKDYDDHWYQDEFGVMRNSYDKKDEDEFYTDEELAKFEAEAKLKQENQSKSDTTDTAVEPKHSVIDTPKISDPPVAVKDAKKEAAEKIKLPRPADFDDNWYQDHAGNWLNRYNKDGLEYENNGPPTSILSGQKDTPLKKTKQKVSFESDVTSKRRSTKSGKNPRERWLWAYGRIVQVGAFVQTFTLRCVSLVTLCLAAVLLFIKVYKKCS